MSDFKKEFDRWNNHKKDIDQKEIKEIDFHEREIWWCTLGVNIGSEQHSQTGDFSRPVLILKRFIQDIFWGIPLTTKIREGGFRLKLEFNGLQNDLLILQMRSYDRKRLIRKIGVIPESFFEEIRNYIKSFV